MSIMFHITSLLVILATVLCQAVPACEKLNVMMDATNPAYTITTPNYPYKYPPSVSCEFLFQAAPGKRNS